jgi:hypothetical protein
MGVPSREHSPQSRSPVPWGRRMESTNGSARQPIRSIIQDGLTSPQRQRRLLVPEPRGRSRTARRCWWWIPRRMVRGHTCTGPLPRLSLVPLLRARARARARGQARVLAGETNASLRHTTTPRSVLRALQDQIPPLCLHTTPSLDPVPSATRSTTLPHLLPLPTHSGRHTRTPRSRACPTAPRRCRHADKPQAPAPN